jgi:hypothetical protein
MSTGWTFEEVAEQFDIPRLNAIYKYWKHTPPVGIAVARYLGYKAPEPVTKPSDPALNAGMLEALQNFVQG